MKISDYLKLQRDFDRFVLSMWKFSPQPCLSACAYFVKRISGEIHTDAHDDIQHVVEGRMKDLHIQRRPSLLGDWAHKSIGAWAFASYPDLFNKIAECGDVSKIDLSTLRYIPNVAVPKNIACPTRRGIRNNRILHALHTQALSCKGGGNKAIRKL